MKIIVTGYNGSGASAVYSLLREYDGCSYVDRNVYEHNLLNIPNGLFDLEYKLLKRNNALRSDEAISAFKDSMENLYYNDFSWCGGLRNIIGKAFKQILEEFIVNITQYTFEGYWANDLNGHRITLGQIGKDVIKTIIGKEVFSFGKKLVKPEDNLINISFITEEEFYLHARKFLNKYIELINQPRNKHVLFDHLLMPQDLKVFDNYSDENFRTIIVERDLCDLYINGKYIRAREGYRSKYPIDVKEFIGFWKRLKSLEGDTNNERIMRVNLEDLVFNYEETKSKIEKFTGLLKKDHIRESEMFDKNIALKNMNFSMMSSKWESEVKLIRDTFPNQIFDFEKYSRS